MSCRHFYKDLHGKTYRVHLNGEWEGESCVEAVPSTSDTQGWVLRKEKVGSLHNWTWKNTKVYGRVFIVKVLT